MALPGMDYHDAFLLDFVLPQMQSVLDRSSRTYHLLTKTDKDIVTTDEGDYIVSKTELAGEQGIGSVGIDEDLPTPREARFTEAKARLKYHYASLYLKGQEKILSRSGGPKSPYAIRKIFNHKTESLSSGLIKDKNRQLWGDGTGQMSLTDGAGAASKSLVVVNPYVFEVNMLIDIHAASIQEDRVIEAIDYSSRTLTLDANTTWESGVAVTRANALNNEMTGFRKAYLPTSLTNWNVWGTWLEINRDTTTSFRPFFMHNNNSPRDLNFDLLDEFVIGVQENQKDAKQKLNIVMILNSALYRGILKLKRQYNMNNDMLDFRLGYKTPVYETPDGPVHFFMCGKDQLYNDFKNVILALSLSNASIRRPWNMQWRQGVGGSILMPITTRDKEIATLIDYEEFYDPAPWRSGVLGDVRFPAG